MRASPPPSPLSLPFHPPPLSVIFLVSCFFFLIPHSFLLFIPLTGTQAHAVLLHEYHRRVAEGFPLFSTSLAPSLPPSLPSCPDGDDVSTMMRLCLSSSLHIPPPLSRSAYGSSGGGMTGARKGGKEVQRLAPEGDVCLAEEELIQQVRKRWLRCKEEKEGGREGEVLQLVLTRFPLLQVFLPLVTAALATSSSPPSSPVPSPLYLSHVLLHHIGLLQTAIPSSLPPSLSPPQGIESGGKSAIVIPPTLVVILLRLLFHLVKLWEEGREGGGCIWMSSYLTFSYTVSCLSPPLQQRVDRVIRFLRSQQVCKHAFPPSLPSSFSQSPPLLTLYAQNSFPTSFLKTHSTYLSPPSFL